MEYISYAGTVLYSTSKTRLHWQRLGHNQSQSLASIKAFGYNHWYTLQDHWKFHKNPGFVGRPFLEPAKYQTEREKKAYRRHSATHFQYAVAVNLLYQARPVCQSDIKPLYGTVFCRAESTRLIQDVAWVMQQLLQHSRFEVLTLITLITPPAQEMEGQLQGRYLWSLYLSWTLIPIQNLVYLPIQANNWMQCRM